MSARIRVVDAFASAPFTGNPAAVCLLEPDGFPDVAWMQAVAAEMNLSETAFAHRLPGDADAGWALRWFTPTVEVGLCGHATLAAAHVIGAPRVRFATLSGVLTAVRRPDGAIVLDFPANAPTPATMPDGLAEALGVTPLAVYGTGALGDLLAEVDSEQVVRGLNPDVTALSRVDARGVIVTAAAGKDSGFDFVSRFFAPAVGIAEDPVTGSAHTALAPFWSARLGRDTLTGLQVSARTGVVGTRVAGTRVELTGHAVTVLDGQLHV